MPLIKSNAVKVSKFNYMNIIYLLAKIAQIVALNKPISPYLFNVNEEKKSSLVKN